MDATQKQINEMLGVSDEVFAKYNPSSEAVRAKETLNAAAGLTETQAMINKALGISEETWREHNPVSGEEEHIITKRIICSMSSPEGAPQQWRLWPRGWVELEGGKPFFVDDEAMTEVLTNFERRGMDIVIDYEHQSLSGDKAPAAGWIKGLEIKEDGLWANSIWTPTAQRHLKEREYRFFSPVFDLRLSDHRPVAIHSVALTNLPQTNHLRALVN